MTICLVGCGNIGALHAKNLSPFADLYFCSRSRASAERFNEQFAGRGVLDGFEAVLDAEGIDGVVVSSPPEFHADQIVACLAAGKAVLVEKPMCVSPEEVGRIEGALGEHPGSLLMVAENYYYKPSLARVKALIAEGFIGDLRSISVKKLSLQEPSGWKRKYGALLEGGIHFVALISDIVDDSPCRVAAEFPGRVMGEPERQSVALLEYPDGSRAELRYSWNTPSLLKGVLQHSHIHGTRGKITFESNGIYVLTRRRGGLGAFRLFAKDVMGYGGMMQDFLACLEDRSRKPFSDFTRAKRDLQVVFSAYEAGGLG